MLLGDEEVIIMVNMLHWLNSEPAINAINNNLEKMQIIGTPFSFKKDGSTKQNLMMIFVAKSNTNTNDDD